MLRWLGVRSSITTSRRGRVLAGVSVSAALAVTASACGGDSAGSGGSSDADGRVQVVASTNVWAGVVSAVGGDQVEATALIDDPSADPHSYQAGAVDAAEVRSADLLVYNGGGYDDFFVQLAENAEAPAVVAVDSADGADGADSGSAGERSAESGDEHAEHEHGDEGDGHGEGHEDGGHGDEGHGHDDGGHEGDGHGGHEGHGHAHDHAHGNEHVWYDLPVVAAVADQVAADLGELLPEQRATFEDNAAAFTERVDELHHRVESLAADHEGTKVAATEPIAHYLLLAAGVDDATPREFAAAVENETDVPVAAQQRMLELVGGEVDAVVRNTQTATPATEKVIAAAREAGTPIVDVTETLPDEQTDYIAWMSRQVDALEKALDE
ncbi:metal ABC transporter substrate-binding protein [Saccharomonospora piscinae]|uniref:Metal ABC transporter substrate-binding protein n=1 Tax=Saccharomonospora piscinae TaxID=687388 RepID=A0A1V9A6R6_SACPI|nr:metal ABC transporter substrate-binding protein [Saccharomonospora piscinae]